MSPKITPKKWPAWAAPIRLLLAILACSLPRREAYETVRQFDAISGGAIEPVALGEIAFFKTCPVTLEAVLNDWYMTLSAQGFDRKHPLLLTELLQERLLSYPSTPRPEPK